MIAHNCLTLKPPGECFRCDLNRDEMPDARVAFEMYTDEGNKACQRLVDRIAEEIRQGILTRNALAERVGALCKIVAEVHPEVWDTEPQYDIAREVSKLCTEQGWLPIDREDW